MYRYKRKRRGATLISRVLAVARKMSPISRAFAETKGKIGGGGWKRRQKFPSRSSWRNMSETKAATESQLAKQRARNAMSEKARGRWGGRKGGGERESWWKGKRTADSWWFPWWITPPVSSTFFPSTFPPPFSLLCFFEGANKGRRRRRASFEGFGLFTLTERYCLLPDSAHSRLYFFNGRHGWDFLWLSRIDARSGSNDILTKFSNA